MQGSSEEKPTETPASTPVYRVARNVKFGDVAIIIVGGEEVAIKVKTCRGRGRFRISVSSQMSDMKVTSRKSN